MPPAVYDIVQTCGQAFGSFAQMKTRELTAKQVSAVACPTCSAPVGAPCVLLSGGMRSEPHLDRRFSATEAIEKEQIRRAPGRRIIGGPHVDGRGNGCHQD
jgi:hypothetical protein